MTDFNINNNCVKCGGSGYIEQYMHVENGRCFLCNNTYQKNKITSSTSNKATIKYNKKLYDELTFLEFEFVDTETETLKTAVLKHAKQLDRYIFDYYRKHPEYEKGNILSLGKHPSNELTEIIIRHTKKLRSLL